MDELEKVNLAQVRRAADLKKTEPTEDLTDDLFRLSSALKRKGYVKQAQALDKRILQFKTAETSLYHVFDETGDELLDFAYPKGLEISKGEYGTFLTPVEQAERIRDVVRTEPRYKEAQAQAKPVAPGKGAKMEEIWTALRRDAALLMERIDRPSARLSRKMKWSDAQKKWFDERGAEWATPGFPYVRYGHIDTYQPTAAQLVPIFQALNAGTGDPRAHIDGIQTGLAAVGAQPEAQIRAIVNRIAALNQQGLWGKTWGLEPDAVESDTLPPGTGRVIPLTGPGAGAGVGSTPQSGMPQAGGPAPWLSQQSARPGDLVALGGFWETIGNIAAALSPAAWVSILSDSRVATAIANLKEMFSIRNEQINQEVTNTNARLQRTVVGALDPVYKALIYASKKEDPKLLKDVRPVLTQARGWLKAISGAFQGNGYADLIGLLNRIEKTVLRGMQTSRQVTLLEDEMDPATQELKDLGSQAATLWASIADEMLRQRQPLANRKNADLNAQDTQAILSRLRRPEALYYFFENPGDLGRHKELQDRVPGLRDLLDSFIEEGNKTQDWLGGGASATAGTGPAAAGTGTGRGAPVSTSPRPRPGMATGKPKPKGTPGASLSTPYSPTFPIPGTPASPASPASDGVFASPRYRLVSQAGPASAIAPKGSGKGRSKRKSKGPKGQAASRSGRSVGYKEGDEAWDAVARMQNLVKEAMKRVMDEQVRDYLGIKREDAVSAAGLVNKMGDPRWGPGTRKGLKEINNFLRAAKSKGYRIGDVTVDRDYKRDSADKIKTAADNNITTLITFVRKMGGPDLAAAEQDTVPRLWDYVSPTLSRETLNDKFNDPGEGKIDVTSTVFNSLADFGSFVFGTNFEIPGAQTEMPKEKKKKVQLSPGMLAEQAVAKAKANQQAAGAAASEAATKANQRGAKAKGQAAEKAKAQAKGASQRFRFQSLAQGAPGKRPGNIQAPSVQPVATQVGHGDPDAPKPISTEMGAGDKAAEFQAALRWFENRARTAARQRIPPPGAQSYVAAVSALWNNWRRFQEGNEKVWRMGPQEFEQYIASQTEAPAAEAEAAAPTGQATGQEGGGSQRSTDYWRQKHPFERNIRVQTLGRQEPFVGVLPGGGLEDINRISLRHFTDSDTTGKMIQAQYLPQYSNRPEKEREEAGRKVVQSLQKYFRDLEETWREHVYSPLKPGETSEQATIAGEKAANKAARMIERWRDGLARKFEQITTRQGWIDRDIERKRKQQGVRRRRREPMAPGYHR